MVESKATRMKFLAFFILIGIIILKIIITGVNHWVITDAIRDYQMECIMSEREYFVDYEDKEDFEETMFRWWDWTHHRILPEEKYNLLMPYIGKSSLTEEFVDAIAKE